MKKLLLVALMAVLGLSIATDALALFGFGRRGYWGRGYGYGAGYYGGGYGYGGNCSRGGCGSSCEPELQCPPPPCCEREETVTVRVPPKMVCGWVCPDGTNEIPTSEARLVNDY